MTSMPLREAARMFQRSIPLIAILVCLLSLAGCAGTLGGAFTGTKEASKTSTSPISFAPIIGAPANVSKSLSGQLVSAAQKQKIPVITQKGKSADYTVRGYLAASQDKKSNKLAYIWDVTDKSGKRVHRIIGEESTPAKAGRDAWSTFDQPALQKIASKTATDLAKWLPQKTAPASAQPVVAAQPPATYDDAQSEPTARTASRRTTRATPPPTFDDAQSADEPISRPVARPTTPAEPTEPEKKTASVKTGDVKAYVPSVSGAPGDGRKSLTSAIKKQLTSKGVKLASSSSNSTYTVRGKVNLGKASGGQQDIKIEWQVLDPGGKRLGTVSQANKIPKGSLDKKWGPIADAAANAAADGIVKLIPKR